MSLVALGRGMIVSGADGFNTANACGTVSTIWLADTTQM